MSIWLIVVSLFLIIALFLLVLKLLKSIFTTIFFMALFIGLVYAGYYWGIWDAIGVTSVINELISNVESFLRN